MFRNSHMLAPTDFSPHAAEALRRAKALAKTYDGTLHLLHVADARLAQRRPHVPEDAASPYGAPGLERMGETASKWLEDLARELRAEGVTVETHTAAGRPAEEIMRMADELQCGLIVIATHGHTGFDRFVFGGVCDQVIRRARIPVLSVRPRSDGGADGDGAGAQGPIRRVLFPTDFSAFAGKVQPHAVSLCKELGAELVLFHATEMPVILPEFMLEETVPARDQMEQYAWDALEHLRKEITDVPVTIQSTVGTPYREICQAIETMGIDLAVLPTHGRSGLVRIFFGGVAERVVRRAVCPVLTIRPELSPELEAGTGL